MNNTGFFFSGVLVGVVVSAAFGLDFFPRGVHETGTVTRPLDTGLTGTSSPLSPEAQAELDADLDATRQKIANLEKKLMGTETALRSKEAEVTTLEARLKASPPRAQEDLDEERQRARRLEADLELSHQETYNLLKRFFASKRSLEDAILISEYFATSAPEKLKGDLVDQLLRTNREVIASLAPVSSLFTARGGVGGLAPVSTKSGVSRPRAAVLRGDQRDQKNLDRQQKTDASDSSPSDRVVPRDQKAVELPPPPGE